MNISEYENLIARKLASVPPTGLVDMPKLPDGLFPHQIDLINWALRRGRAAIFADTGLGKSRMQLAWADAVHRSTGNDVLTELRQRAIARYSQVNGYVDLRRGWLLVDTASRRMGEVMVSAIREALGSFPAQPVHANAPVRVILTDWLRGAQPADFDIGSEFTLADPVDSSIVARFSGSDPDADEIRAHLDAGMKCARLGLIFRNHLTFTLDTALTIRKLRLLDTCDSEAPGDAAGTFALYSGQIGQLLDRLAFEFEIVGAE